MKNKLVTLVALFVLAVTGFAHEDSIKLNATSMYGIETKTWKYGLNLPIVSLEAMTANDKKDTAYIGVLLLTEKEMNSLYAGVGLTMPFIHTKSVSLTGTIGWYGGFNNLRKPVSAEPGLGLGLTIRF